MFTRWKAVCDRNQVCWLWFDFGEPLISPPLCIPLSKMAIFVLILNRYIIFVEGKVLLCLFLIDFKNKCYYLVNYQEVKTFVHTGDHYLRP